jgi:hypothetical protein
MQDPAPVISARNYKTARHTLRAVLFPLEIRQTRVELVKLARDLWDSPKELADLLRNGDHYSRKTSLDQIVKFLPSHGGHGERERIWASAVGKVTEDPSIQQLSPPHRQHFLQTCEHIDPWIGRPRLNALDVAPVQLDQLGELLLCQPAQCPQPSNILSEGGPAIRSQEIIVDGKLILESGLIVAFLRLPPGDIHEDLPLRSCPV